MAAIMTGDELTSNKTISDIIEDIIGQILSAHPETPTITPIAPPTPPPATAEIPPQPATTTSPTAAITSDDIVTDTTAGTTVNNTVANTITDTTLNNTVTNTTSATTVDNTITSTTTVTSVNNTITNTATTTATSVSNPVTKTTANTTITTSTELNGQPQPAVEQNGGSSVGSSSGEKPKRKRKSSSLLSDVESSEPSESGGGRTKRARTKTQLFQSPGQIATRMNRSASQSDFDETLSEKSKEDSQKKKVEYEKYQILAVRSESGFYLCRTAQGSRSNSDLKIEWLDSKDEKHYTLTKHFDKVTHASVLAELYLDKLKLPDQRSRTYILDDDSRNIIEKALRDSLKLGKDKVEPCQAEVKLNDSKEESPSTRRRRSTRNS